MYGSPERFEFSRLALLSTFAAGAIASAFAADSVHDTPFQVGQTYFERAGTNSAHYPLLPGVNDVAATPRLPKPYRLRSFLGGLLWGTGELADFHQWVDVPPEPARWNEGHWQQLRLDQQPIYLNPVMLHYNWAPGQFGNDPNQLEPRTRLDQGGIYNGFAVTNFAYPTNLEIEGTPSRIAASLPTPSLCGEALTSPCPSPTLFQTAIGPPSSPTPGNAPRSSSKAGRSKPFSSCPAISGPMSSTPNNPPAPNT